MCIVVISCGMGEIVEGVLIMEGLTLSGEMGFRMRVQSGLVIVRDCIFEGSYAGSHRSASTFAAVGDSAVVVQSGAITQFNNCIFTRYTAHHGGAVAVVGKSSAHFDNCIFSENHLGEFINPGW